MCFLVHSPFNFQIFLLCKLFYFYLLLLLLLLLYYYYYIIFLYIYILFIYFIFSLLSLLFLHLPSNYPHPPPIPLTSPHSPTLFSLLFFLDGTFYIHLPPFFFVFGRPTHFFGGASFFFPFSSLTDTIPMTPILSIHHRHSSLSSFLSPSATNLTTFHPDVLPSLSLSRFPFLHSFGHYGLHLLDLVVGDSSIVNLHLPMLRLSPPPLLSCIVAFCLQSQVSNVRFYLFIYSLFDFYNNYFQYWICILGFDYVFWVSFWLDC